MQSYVTTTVRLTPEEYDQVELVARRMGISKSALLRSWVRAKIEESRGYSEGERR